MIQINNQHHKDILIIVNGEEDNKTRLGSYNDLSSITWSRKKGYSRCNSRGSQSTMNEDRRPPDPINTSIVPMLTSWFYFRDAHENNKMTIFLWNCI